MISRLVGVFVAIIEYAMWLLFGVFGGFWWMLPPHAQAQFGLPARAWAPGVFLALLLCWLFNRLPSQGLNIVARQPMFAPKVVFLFVCGLAFAYGVTQRA